MKIDPGPKRPSLEELLKAAAKEWNSKSPEEKEAILKAQRDGYVRAEMSWPHDCPYK